MSAEMEEQWAHVRAIAVTSTAALFGVVAAVASRAVTSGMEASEAAGAQDAQLILLGVVAIQLPIYHVVFEEWGGAKDVLYVAFMTFILWFITFGIMLTSGAEIA